MRKPTRKSAKTNKELRVARQKELSCSICPPNKGENASRKPVHGTKKPRYKNKRNIL